MYERALSLEEAFRAAGSFEGLACQCPHCGTRTRWERRNTVVVSGVVVPPFSVSPLTLGTVEIATCSHCLGLAIGVARSVAARVGDMSKEGLVLYPDPLSPRSDST